MSCQVWGTSGFQWGKASWKWSECGPTNPIPPIPVVTIENRPGVDATTLIQPWQEEEQWNPYKAGDEERKRKRRIVELICKTPDGKYDFRKELKNVTVKVDKVKLSVKEPLKIDLTIT
jgi:hypothetical protein